MRSSLFLTAVVSWLMVPAAASAALKFSYQRTRAGGQTEANTLILDNRHLRMEGLPGGEGGPHASPGGHVVVLDAEGRRVLMISPARKTYREMTEADFKQMRQRMTEAKAQMAEKMKNMPPEKRKMMEQMMGPGMGGGGEPPAMTYVSLGQQKKIAGFACELYRVSMAGRAVSESCLAGWSSSLITKAEAEQFKKLGEDLRQMFDMGTVAPAHDFSKMPGFPVEDSHFGMDGKTIEWTNTLKSIDRPQVPSTMFQAPADYTKEAMPGPPGGGPGRHGRAPRP